METETEQNPWTSALHHAEQYASLKYELYKYEMIERAARVGSSVSTSMINVLVLFVCILLLILGGAFAIGEYSGHLYLGFALAGAFFLLGFFIMIGFRKSISRKIMDFYIQKAFEHEKRE